MPRVCTSQPAKAELQVPGSAAAGPTTAGVRGQQLNPAGYGASWAPAKVSPRAQLWARANPQHPGSLPVARAVWCEQQAEPVAEPSPLHTSGSQPGHVVAPVLFPGGGCCRSLNREQYSPLPASSVLPSISMDNLANRPQADTPLGEGQTLLASSSVHPPGPHALQETVPSCASHLLLWLAWDCHHSGFLHLWVSRPAADPSRTLSSPLPAVGASRLPPAPSASSY